MDACIEQYKRYYCENPKQIPLQSIKVDVLPLAGDETPIKMKSDLIARNNKNTHLYKVTVRDTGTGVKYDQIEPLLTEYFSSTKAQNSQKIGCFGLGVRAILLYSHKFTTHGKIKIKTKTANKNKMATVVLKCQNKMAKIDKKEIELSLILFCFVLH